MVFLQEMGSRPTIRKLWWFSSNMVISWKDVKARRTSNSVKLRSRRLRMRE